MTTFAQTLPRPPRVWLLFLYKAGYKRAVRGTTIWSNGKEHFLPSGQSGPCTFKFRSEQTKAVRSIGCTNQNFRNFGSIGKRPMNYWKYVSNFPSPDWHIGDGFFNFSIMARSQILVNTLHPRTLYRHCFAD